MTALLDRVVRAMLAMQRHSWEQGLAGQALLALGDVRTARVVAADAIARQLPDGRLGELDPRCLVNGAANLDAVDARAAGGDRSARAAAAQQRAWLSTGCPRARDGVLFHLAGSRQVWADTVYLAGPALVGAGPAGPTAALDQLAGHRARLFDPVAGLYAARWDEDAGVLLDARRWATGNGWVLAGSSVVIARIQARPPATAVAAGVADLVRHTTALLETVLAHRRDDGSLGDVLDDSASFSDVSPVAMTAYAIARGVEAGWLSGRWRSTVASLLATVRSRVDDDGVVTGVCGAPGFDRPGASVEAQAMLVLASTAGARIGLDRADLGLPA